MHDPLTLLLHTLDAPPPAGLPQVPHATPPLACFIRDDDAGWDDDRLFDLIDTTAAAGVPLDLAAIPAAVGDALAQRLADRHDAAPGLLGIHQHGWTHDNHQREGRKAEFGTNRDAATQAQDLARGRTHLQALFGTRLDGLFSPPWNRCAPWTPALLADMAYTVLSQDRSAASQHNLPHLPVDLNWSRLYREGGPQGLAQAWADGLAAALAPVGPGATAPATWGLMLHHAAMAPEELALLRQWLTALAQHPRLRWLPMRACVPLATHAAPG